MRVRSLALLLTVAAAVGCQPDASFLDTTVGTIVVEVADVGFQTPESVLHDTAGDVYLVSNINGAPAEKDDNGFISRLTPDGQVEQLKWIDGEAPNVTLHAPKGMAIRGDTLYVADIDCVRMFVRTTGAPAGEVCIQGATFLNDVAVGPDGTVHVTDSGLNPDFSPSGTDAIWRFTPGVQPTRLTSGTQLGNPNGITFGPDGNGYVATFGTGEIYQVGPGGERSVVIPGIAERQLDGIEFVSGGGYVFSSWGDRAVLFVDQFEREHVVLEDVESPADLGYDRQRNRVLVPLFNDNRVIIAEIRMPAPPPL